MLHNVVLDSTVQQSKSAVSRHISRLFGISFLLDQSVFLGH